MYSLVEDVATCNAHFNSQWAFNRWVREYNEWLDDCRRQDDQRLVEAMYEEYLRNNPQYAEA